MTLIYSSNQTEGRGRLNRKWIFNGEENNYKNENPVKDFNYFLRNAINNNDY